MRRLVTASHAINTRTTLALLLILMIAAGLRLYRLDLIDYRYDEATSIQYALDIVNGRFLAVAPFSGSLAAHPPLYLYVLAIPLIFSRNLLVIITYRVLLDVGAIALVWLICMRYTNIRVAVLASLLFAVAPAAIFSARRTSIELLPLFTLVLLFGIYEVWIRRSPKGWIWMGLGLALCIGTHLSSIYFVPIVLITAIARRQTIKPANLLIALLPMMLLVSIYLIYDSQNDFQNVKALSSAAGAVAAVNFDALQQAFWTSGGAHTSDLAGSAIAKWQRAFPQWLLSIDDLQQCLLALSVILPIAAFTILLVRRRRNRSKNAGNGLRSANSLFSIITVLFWLLPIVLQLRHTKPIALHYLTILYPTPFVIMALGLDSLLTLNKRITMRLGKWQKPVYYSIAGGIVFFLIVIGVWQVVTVVALTGFVERTDTTGGYGLPLHSALTAADELKRAALEGVIGPVVVVIEDYVTPWHEQGIILNTLLADIPHRFINSKVDGWIFRPEGTSYIFAPGTETNLQKLLMYLDKSAVDIRMTPIRSEGGPGYTYVRVKSLPDMSRFTKARPAIWETGIALEYYRAALTKNGLDIDTAMTVSQSQPDNTDYHWFTHLFEEAKQLAQTDVSGIHPSSWRAGDILLQSFHIPITVELPDKPLYIRYGSYHFPKTQSVMVSEDGKKPENGVNLAMPYPLK